MSPVFDNIDQFVDGFLTSLEIILYALAGALPLGVLIAACRVSPIPPLRWVGTAYVTVFRNAPLTVVFFFAAFGLPALGSNADFLRVPGVDQVFSRIGIDLPYFRFAIIALSLYTGAFVCEALRSGINAVPAGQAEAARSIGLTFGQNLRFVVLPQAWKAAIVPLGSVIIAMIKNSALAGFFGVVGDLSNSGYALITVQGEPTIPIMIGISIGFLILTVPLGILLDRIEKRRAVAR